jgi:hypothetical protein
VSAKAEEKILFEDLIQTCSFGNVRKSLLTFYPDQKININGYRYIFATLRRMRHKKNKEGMKIRIEKVGRGKHQYFDVSGICAECDHQSYALEFTSWVKWLGYEVEQVTLKKIPREEIVAHCLWEMTFVGFTQNKIRRRLAALKRQVKDIKEGRMKTIPHEEVITLLEPKVKGKLMTK